MRSLIAVLLTCGAAAAALIAGPAGAQTGYPMIISAYPVGLQRGQTTEVTVTGRYNFAGAYGAQFESPGLTAEITQTDSAKPVDTCKLKIAVAADAPLGAQEFRIATPRGLSSLGVLVI